MIGLNREVAASRAEAVSLSPAFYGPPGGVVASQSPLAAQKVKAGSMIQLQMAMLESATVPSLIGQPRGAAASLTEAANLKPIFSGLTGGGTVVILQSPPVGQKIMAGSYIQLQTGFPNSSVEPKISTVPYFFLRSREAAASLAKSANLILAFSGSPANDAVVNAQSPEPGLRVKAGSTIQLQMAVSESATVPSLVGQSRGAAASLTEAANLKPSFYGPEGASAVVGSQSPPVGQKIMAGSFIQLQMVPKNSH